MLPAAGQGALGIEVCSDRADLLEALGGLADQPTWLAVTAERTVSRAMGGSCSMPLASFTTSVAQQADGPAMRLRAAWGDPASAEALSGLPLAPLVHAEQSAVVRTFDEAEALGESVAAQLRAGGAVWAAPAASASAP